MESILWLIYSASICFVYWIGIERSGWINDFEAEMVQIPKSMKFIAKIEIFRSGAIHSMDWNWASYGIAQTHQDRYPFLMYWGRTVDCCNAFNCCFFYHFTAFSKEVHFFKILRFSMYDFYNVFAVQWSSKVLVLPFSIRSSYYQLHNDMLLLSIGIIFPLNYTCLYNLLHNHNENPTSTQECIFFRIHLTNLNPRAPSISIGI